MRNVQGVGINDARYRVRTVENGKVKVCPFYARWQNMLRRAYCKKYKKQNPSYREVTVCREWHSFMSFRCWMEAQDWEGKQLDKDILLQGNKEYSPKTCVFVCSKVNTFFHENGSIRGNSPIGVSWDSVKGKFSGKCSNPVTGKSEHLGYFDNPDDAHTAWKKRKYELACLLASEQEDARVAKSMIERYKYE